MPTLHTTKLSTCTLACPHPTRNPQLSMHVQDNPHLKLSYTIEMLANTNQNYKMREARNDTVWTLCCLCHKVKMIWKLLTWHCCNSSQAAGCRSWFVGMNLHNNSVPHYMWSVVCEVDLQRSREGRGHVHRGSSCCNCRYLSCRSTCEESDMYPSFAVMILILVCN